MWASAIELGIPALLVFALWRIWPREAGPEHKTEDKTTTREDAHRHDPEQP